MVGGGLFILVEKSITPVEQTSFITEGEIEWVKVKIKNNKDLLVGSFYRFTPGLTPFSHDSVAHIISGLR
jgi:hypothetical protein